MIDDITIVQVGPHILLIDLIQYISRKIFGRYLIIPIPRLALIMASLV